MSVPTPDSPTARSLSPEEEKARLREERIAFWRKEVARWDWFPVLERLRQSPPNILDPSFKLGARRALMNRDPAWLRSLSPPEVWLDEYCFDEAVRQVAADMGLELEIDQNTFWVKLAE